MTVKVWDGQTGQELLTFRKHMGEVFGVAFSPDGSCLASAGSGKTGAVRFWDPRTGEEICPPWELHAGRVVFSPDGRYLAAHTTDQKDVFLWDRAAGRVVLTLTGNTGLISYVAFSPDGRRLASAGYDHSVRVWDLGTGQEVFTLKGHTDSARCVAFHPRGTRLASAGIDGVVRVWNLTIGQEVLALKGHGGEVYTVAFSPDGNRLVSGGKDKTVRVWDAPPRDAGPEPVAGSGP
jgi:WD40 repeat protein